MGSPVVPREPMHWLEVTDPITDSPATYVGYSVVNSVLSGLLIAVLAGWAMVVFNRIWQGFLTEEAAGGIEAAKQRGLVLHPPGLRARRVADGAIGSERIRVEWRGDWRGPHSVVYRGDRLMRRPLITDTASLDAVLQER